ncbi:MAG: DUF447 domain-containing protein [Haloferacaceae archaeon]
MTDVPGWPVDLRGITESVVTTPGPDGRWNLAALGLHAPVRGADGGDATGRAADGPAADAVTAVTWGDTRTRRNFAREGRGVVQFTSDPRTFVDAALSVVERDDPVLDDADAWVRVGVERVAAGEERGTRWRRWRLDATDGEVRRERVPTINRGFAAVIDATVAASRLDVAAYETDALLDRLDRLADVVETCGGPREREAFARVDAHTGRCDRS